MSESSFDVIPYEVCHAERPEGCTNVLGFLCSQDIQGNWKKLGSGSFGNVYKGQQQDLTFA